MRERGQERRRRRGDTDAHGARVHHSVSWSLLDFDGSCIEGDGCSCAVRTASGTSKLRSGVTYAAVARCLGGIRDGGRKSPPKEREERRFGGEDLVASSTSASFADLSLCLDFTVPRSYCWERRPCSCRTSPWVLVYEPTSTNSCSCSSLACVGVDAPESKDRRVIGSGNGNALNNDVSEGICVRVAGVFGCRCDCSAVANADEGRSEDDASEYTDDVEDVRAKGIGSLA